MFCMKCGATLPEGAKFCFVCGAAVTAPPDGSGGGPSAPKPAPAAPTLAAAGVQELKCPSCGAPIHPQFGEMIVTCDYCGGTVTLGGAGWKEVSKHSMLAAKLIDPGAALEVVKEFVDTGLFHHKIFAESKVTSQKLTMVPYWILPVTASTNYQYQDAAVGIGSTVAAMAGSIALGEAMGGGRGMMVMPIMAGPVVNPTRQDTITGNYEYPVVAVRAMGSYQPKNYEFQLVDRGFFDKKAVPAGAAVLNGDLSEDAARNSARAYVTQLQSDTAHKRHRMVSHFQTQVDVSEGELLHAPVWEIVIEYKGESRRLILDGHSSRVMS